MKYLGDCTISEVSNIRGDWAYIEDYLFQSNGTLIIIGIGYHTYNRCGWVIFSRRIKNEI